MDLLVFEYACAGGEGGEPFLEEGRLMLSTLLRDISKLKGCSVSTIVSRSFGADLLFAGKTVTAERNPLGAFSAELERNDAVWIIAPETGRRLLELTRMAESAGLRVIGSSSSAVETCGDKLSTYTALNGAVPVPETELYTGYVERFPSVIKPADGAGCENTFLVREGRDVPMLDAAGYILQEFIQGEAMSAGFADTGDGPILLGVSRQIIEYGKKVEFRGIEGPVDYPQNARIEFFAEEIKKRIPGLSGYWGLDFVDTSSGPVVIEINPRLTSSFTNYRLPYGMMLADGPVCA